MPVAVRYSRGDSVYSRHAEWREFLRFAVGELVPQKRENKHGVMVTKYVRATADDGSKGASKVPAPMAAKKPIPDCPDGWIDLYHRTTPEALAAITESGKMVTKENTPEVFFSTVSEGGQGDGYGSAVVWIRVPEDDVEIDDEFPDGEQHFRVPIKSVTKSRMLPYH
jgi:hypothetical protein